MLIESAVGVSLITIGGIGWYVRDILSVEAETHEDVFEAVPVENREASKNDLIQIGTGNKAELMLGSEIHSGRSAIFVSGAINNTVYTLLRSFMRYDTRLELLFNPMFGGNVEVADLDSRFMADVKETSLITGDGLTLLNIDGDKVFMIRHTNNAIIKIEGDTMDEAMMHNRNMWAQASSYN